MCGRISTVQDGDSDDGVLVGNLNRHPALVASSTVFLPLKPGDGGPGARGGAFGAAQCAGFVKSLGCAYLWNMLKTFEFCLPTNATKVPAGPEWFHEIKHDGFRVRVERDGDRVRLNYPRRL